MNRLGLTLAWLFASTAAGAQQQRPDSARCDSIIGTMAVDTVPTGLYIRVRRIDDGPEPDADLLDDVVSAIVHAFKAPRPFRLSVFEGPLQMRGLRLAGSDTLRETRAPSVSGVYALWVTDAGPTAPSVLRSSFMRGLDSAMLSAIAAPTTEWRLLQRRAGLAARYQIRLSGDSTDDSRMLAYGRFPRVRVNDATPLTGVALRFPDDARADRLDHGETVLRFVVDRDGSPAPETVEIVRTTNASFARAAITALAEQKFKPASIAGCPIAQLVEFPFIFDAERTPPPQRAP